MLTTASPYPEWADEFPAVPEVVPPTWGLWLPGGEWQGYGARRAWLVSQGWGDRRLRLLACASAGRAVTRYERRHPDDSRPRRAVEVAASYADGLATEDQLTVARKTAWDADAAAAYAAAYTADAAAAARAAAERVHQSRIVSLWLPVADWHAGLETSNARGLAAAIYEDGRWDRMPILADTLDDAGYAGEPWLTAAMRTTGVPWGRGCWVVDRLTGRIA